MLNTPSLFKQANGKMPYMLTNDYLFRATLQKSNKALKGLICALLHKAPDEIISVEIINPIELGKNIEAKNFILDIRVQLNGSNIVNLEMQIINYGNWPERSLGYLCRSFDHLNSGQDYMDTKKVHQICFLDFTLFPENPEFYANYMFLNIKNRKIYSDKIKLSVVDLTKISLATEEDKLYQIDAWASLFKATTWEELKMITKDNEYLKEAAETAYQLSAEEAIRLQCEAREDFYRQQRYVEHKIASLTKENTAAKEEITQLRAELERLQSLLNQKTES